MGRRCETSDQRRGGGIMWALCRGYVWSVFLDLEKYVNFAHSMSGSSYSIVSRFLTGQAHKNTVKKKKLYGKKLGR